MSREPAQERPPYWNVPFSQNTFFMGRADELDRLRQNFARQVPRTPVQAIYGLGGIGKTQLALEYAYRFARDYEVVWWLRAEDPATLAADFADLAVALRLPGRSEPDKRAAIEAVKQWLSQQTRWLLIFDSAKEPKDLIQYLPTSILGHVLVTSRRSMWAGLSLPLQLRPMKRGDAVDLLLARSGRKLGPDSAQSARELAEALGDLPLALAQAGAYIEETGVAVGEYLDRFREHRAELMSRGAEGDGAPTVSTTWELAFRDVRDRSPAAVELLNLCAFLGPDDIPREDLAHGEAAHEGFPPALGAAARDPFALDDVIKALRRYSLIDVPDDSGAASFAVHRLVQAAVRDRLDEEDRRAWARRAVAFVCAVFPDDAADLSQRGACRRWLPHARAALAHARAQRVPPSEEAERLLRHAAEYQHACGFDESAREMLEQALSLAEALHGPTHAHVAMAAAGLGPVLLELGDVAGALRNARRALVIDVKNRGERDAIVATDYVNIAGALRRQGDLDEAQRHVAYALAIDEALGSENLSAVARDARIRGAILRDLEELEEARACFERALAIDEPRGGEDVPRDLNNLSLLLREMKEFEEAEQLAVRALEVGVQMYGPDDTQVATFHSNLGFVLNERGKLREARPHLERALEIGEKTYGSDHYAIAIRRNNLGLLLRDLGDRIGARRELERAVAIARKALGPEHRRVKKLESNLARIIGELAGPTSSRR